jgi:hypothetical protein
MSALISQSYLIVLWVLYTLALLFAMLMLCMFVLVLLLVCFVSGVSIVLDWLDSEQRRVRSSTLSKQQMNRFQEEVDELLRTQSSSLK